MRSGPAGGRSAFTPRRGRARKGGKPAALALLGGQAEALRGDRAPILVHLLDTSRGVAETNPAVRTVTTWPRPPCLGLSRRRRVDMLCLRFGTQRRQPRRRQVCARRDALSSWHEVRRPLPHRPGPSTRTRDRRWSSEALVSILHAGGERAWRGLLPSARTAGCVVAFVIAELRAPSRSCTRCRCHAPRLPVPLARAASSASRVPSAWRPSRPRAAPPPPCTRAHASASSSADRLSWATFKC